MDRWTPLFIILFYSQNLNPIMPSTVHPLAIILFDKSFQIVSPLLNTMNTNWMDCISLCMEVTLWLQGLQKIGCIAMMQALHVVYFGTFCYHQPKCIIQESTEHPVHIINGLENIFEFLLRTLSSRVLGFLECRCQMCIVVKTLWKFVLIVICLLVLAFLTLGRCKGRLVRVNGGGRGV